MSNEIEVKKGGLSAMMSAKFGMDPAQFVDTIKATVMPSTASGEEVAAFLMVAKEYDLNPITREIHAFPKKGGGIQTVVGIDGWAKIITRHKDFNGAEFSYDAEAQSVTCSIFRKSTDHPVVVTEYLDECMRQTDPWKTMPKRMLRHKAFMQAGRYAFGISGVCDSDEAQDFCDVVVTGEDVIIDPDKKMRSATSQKVASNITDKLKPKQTTEEPADFQKLLTDKLKSDCDGNKNAMQAVFEMLTGATTMSGFSEHEKLYREITGTRRQEYVDALGALGLEEK